MRTGPPNRFARELFTPLPARYDFLEELLSFRQNARWRRKMLDAVTPSSPSSILDVATGTAGVAIDLSRRTGVRVVGLDLTEKMLLVGRDRVRRKGLDGRIDLLLARAEQIPFRDGAFDALTFTYLLRYVADPAATIEELARVVGPGGKMASLEFGVPPNPLWRLGWWIYTRAVLPVAGALFGRGWYRVGRFLSPSISGHYRRYPVEWHVEAWQDAGMVNVGFARMTLGAGLVMWGTKGRPATLPLLMSDAERPAFYAARPGRWRDWWTILHPPYTAWHLSYVVIGGCLAPAFDWRRLLATVVAFFLAVGIAAHALDELNGHPLKTRISDAALWIAAGFGVSAAVAIGVLGVTRVGFGLVPFIAVGAFLVLAYNLEWFGGRFHSDAVFAAAWGAFPVLTSYFAQAETITAAAVAAALGAFALSAAQRALSTPARRIRRRTEKIEGSMVMTDGTVEPVDRAALLGPLEGALRALSVSVVALAVALLLSRLL